MRSFDDVTSWPLPDPMDPGGSRRGHGFRRGDRVRILGGPFEGFAGVIDSVLPTGVRVVIELFGSPSPVDARFDEVEKL